jgi:UDP-N-acetylmuramoyl-L-alanyl-D-glutamate--2,6-diaminopimelate ligase
MSFALAGLLRGIETTSISGGVDPAKVVVAEVRDDSRQVRAGDLFVAVPGVALDGRRSPAEPRFVADAVARGATVLVTEGAAPTGFSGVVVTVPSARGALGLIAANRFAAAAELSLFAITGTNGKTTMTYLVEGMLRAAGRVPGVIGTIDCHSAAPGFAAIPSSNTTPGALALQSMLAGMRAAGTTDVALEATSHALDQDRLAGCLFRVAALTNLTQDHLDYHGTMERYFDAKAILFERMLRPDGVGVTFVDDEHGRRMRQRCKGRTLGVARQPGPLAVGAEIVVEQVLLGAEGIHLKLTTPRGPLEIISPLVGEFNVENLALAVGVGVAADLPLDVIAKGLGAVTGVPGRLERVPNDRGVLCVVDYAHTPDALERALAAVRPFGKRTILVFGCGGDRDPTKRPRMGAIAAAHATFAIATNDNPRTEEPERILDMIDEGLDRLPPRRLSPAELKPRAARFPEHRGGGVLASTRNPDRRAAIALAAAIAQPGDVVLIAGKGHEDYQIVGKTKSHFDDREEAAAAFARARKAES